MLVILDTEVQFSSSSYIGSESLKGVPVTLLITKGTISVGEEIVVNVVATSHFPVSAKGTYTWLCNTFTSQGRVIAYAHIYTHTVNCSMYA